MVNGYGKRSSTLEVFYKFLVSPPICPIPYQPRTDTFERLSCSSKTLREADFTSRNRLSPTDSQNIQYLFYEGQAQEL